MILANFIGISMQEIAACWTLPVSLSIVVRYMLLMVSCFFIFLQLFISHRKDFLKWILSFFLNNGLCIYSLSLTHLDRVNNGGNKDRQYLCMDMVPNELIPVSSSLYYC